MMFGTSFDEMTSALMKILEKANEAAVANCYCEIKVVEEEGSGYGEKTTTTSYVVKPMKSDE